MKKTTALFVSILILILTMLLPVQAAELDLIFDEVGLLTDGEYFELNELAQEITEQYECEVSIVIIEDKGDGDVTEYAKIIYGDYDYGYGDDKSGLMLLISMEDRDYAIVSYGYGDTAFTDNSKNVLIEKHLLPELGKDKYYTGFLMYLNQAADFLEMAENGTPYDVDTDGLLTEENAELPIWVKLAVTILVPLLIAGVICFILLGTMKTAIPQRAADNYISVDGVNLTMKADKYLYVTETRRPIEEKSTGGGTSAGRGGSSSSKGKF